MRVGTVVGECPRHGPVRVRPRDVAGEWLHLMTPLLVLLLIGSQMRAVPYLWLAPGLLLCAAMMEALVRLGALRIVIQNRASCPVCLERFPFPPELRPAVARLAGLLRPVVFGLRAAAVVAGIVWAVLSALRRPESTTFFVVAFLPLFWSGFWYGSRVPRRPAPPAAPG